MTPVAEPRRSARTPDATSLLRLYAVLLLIVPAELAVAGFGGAVTPLLLMGLSFGLLWILGQEVPFFEMALGPQPVRRVTLLYGTAVLASYVVAATEVRDVIEASAADRGLLITAAACGVALLAADGIRNRTRLDALVRTLVAAGAVAAGIGMVQFVSDLDPVRMLAVPGLSPVESAVVDLTERSGFDRAHGAALHPIEYTAILTMLLPLALHLAHWTKQARWMIAAGLILAAIPMSVSRTGVIGLLTVFVILVPTWDRTRRWRTLGAGVLLAIALKFAVPGLLGTMRALFLSFFEDPSVTSRRDDYTNVGEFVGDNLLFGRGYATFLPEQYDFLDNQYLLGLIEIGILGVLTMVAVFVVGFAVSATTRRASNDPVTRDLAQSLAAAAAVPLVTSATFDLLSFPAARGMAFLIVGCAGALWRIEWRSRRAWQAGRSASGDPVDSVPDEPHAPSRSVARRHRWPIPFMSVGRGT